MVSRVAWFENQHLFKSSWKCGQKGMLWALFSRDIWHFRWLQHRFKRCDHCADALQIFVRFLKLLVAGQVNFIVGFASALKCCNSISDCHQSRSCLLQRVCHRLSFICRRQKDFPLVWPLFSYPLSNSAFVRCDGMPAWQFSVQWADVIPATCGISILWSQVSLRTKHSLHANDGGFLALGVHERFFC